MRAEIKPSKARGKMIAPPSKSMAHRMLICAGLSPKKSIIDGIAASEDMLATIDCLRALGAKIEQNGQRVEIEGIDWSKTDAATLPCRECGSTLRFFVPLALLSGKEITFTGSKRLLARPMSVYEDICRLQGIAYELTEDTLRVCGRLHAGEYVVAGNISSQFISGLCFALPLLEGDSRIRILPPIESRSYIEMTLQALRKFGIEISDIKDNTIEIKGGQQYIHQMVSVEGDYSNAAFFDALNLLGGAVQLQGLDRASLQGDKVYGAHFAALRQKTVQIDLSDCPDLGPICMAMAAACHGAKFTQIQRLRMKESDRCAAMAEELAKFGITSQIQEDTMQIDPGPIHKPTEILQGHNDHRIVMALAILATLTGATIDGAEAVAKSLPDFFERIKRLGIEVELTTERPND